MHTSTSYITMVSYYSYQFRTKYGGHFTRETQTIFSILQFSTNFPKQSETSFWKTCNFFFKHVLGELRPWSDAHINKIKYDGLIYFLSVSYEKWLAFYQGTLDRFSNTWSIFLFSVSTWSFSQFQSETLFWRTHNFFFKHF